MKGYYISAPELAAALDISTPTAYKAIANMNNELKRNGYQVFSGRVPIAYVKQKYYGLTEEDLEHGNKKNDK